MRFIPHTPEDIAAMLKAIGLPDLEALFADIPAELRLKGELNLPAAISEPEVISHLQGLAEENGHSPDYGLFLGAGAYHHFVPPVVEEIISREEFYTAYTPYQAELSQGTLQATFEYQTLICQLTAMEVANASMYDGASAVAEAALMASRVLQRKKILASSALHPDYLAVLRTYLKDLGMELESIPWSDSEGITSIRGAEKLLGRDVAALILQSPNFFGCLEEGSQFAEMAHAQGALLIAAVVEPTSLGILKPPGEWGADIVAGEGQSFGNPLNFGGPYLGFFATREKFVRQMPGRLVGRTVDLQGRPGFVLALATREQHIRREKATSNICTNEALCALAATVHLCLLGPQGLRELALLNLNKAYYAKEKIAGLSGFRLPFSAPTYNEFVVRMPKPVEKMNRRLRERGIIGGLDLGRFFPEMSECCLFCVTEMNSREEMDRLLESLGEITQGGN
jgi:glycine cleavage system P protein (glycine dehydrogenase) subunit 1